MLTAYQIDALRNKSEQLLDPVIEYLIEDIAKRISQARQLTGTASYQIWRAQNLGISQRKLKKEIQKRLKISMKEVEKLLTQAAETGYNFDISRFPTSHAIPFAANSSLQQILDATVKQAMEDLTNITQTIGFVGPDGKFRGLTQAYQQACDFAFQKVTTGAQDYISAVRDATRNLAKKGIRTIDYESGVHTSLEAAVRRNIMGGLGIMQEQISQQNHDALGCDGWELSAHAGSAPDHEPYQGKQYTDEEYTRLNNSLVRRIGTLNCGHAAFPIILGVNSPQYTPEELEKFREDNEVGVEFDGKHYTLDEATQRQRAFERNVRYRKREILIDETLGDKGKLQADQIKLVRLREEYKRFSKGVGLPMQHERMETAGFDWKKGKAAEKTAVEAERADVVTRVKPPSGLVQASIEADRKYVDSTSMWHGKKKSNAPVKDLQEYTINGVTYKVDGRNVVLDYKPKEKEIAKLLSKEAGVEVNMVPRVNNPQGVKTPDYLINGKGYDLKSLHETTGKNPIFNRIKNARGQAKNFILDLTDAGLEEDVVRKQLEKIFSDKDTEFVDEVVVIKNGKIVKALKRKKKS